MKVDEYNSFESQLTRYGNALSVLEKLGIRLASNSRLRTYEQRIELLMRDPRPAVETELVWAASFSLREIDEIIEIVGNLPMPLDNTTLELLEKMGGGAENPDDDESARAREAQYELYLGAVLRRSGIPAEHGAPDLVATWRNEEVFIEAKRPSKQARLDDRVRSAVHQIRKLQSPGIIALSIDQILRPVGRLLRVQSFDDLAPTVADLVQRFLLKHANVWRNRLPGEPIAALLLTARIPARILETGHAALGTNLHLEVLSPDDSAPIEFMREAMKAYMNAQPPLG